MMTMHDRRELFATDFPAYVQEMNRRLRELDAAIAARDTVEVPFREQVARDAVDALEALGVPHPRAIWRMGIVATRVWLLELASPLEQLVDRETLYGAATSPITRYGLLETWRGGLVVPAESPLGEWQLWRFVTMMAAGIRADRLARKFGRPELTLADVAEARLRCEISNEQWERIRERARWVLA